jgi:hypothetical protein
MPTPEHSDVRAFFAAMNAQDADAAAAIRTQRWRNTGEVAAEDNLRASFTFDTDGTISKVVLA